MLAACRRPRTEPPAGRTARFVLRGLAAVPAAGLALFHALLLWHRVTSSSLLEAAVMLRWFAALVLLFALVRLRQAGVPLLWSRQALVFWLLVALLHVGAVPALEARAIEPSTGLVLTLTLSSVFLASLGGLAALTGGRASRGAPAFSVLRRPPAHRADRVRPFASLCPRPPPV